MVEPLKAEQARTFLSEMGAVVPWQSMIALIEPYYPKSSKKGGQQTYPPSSHAEDPPVAALVFTKRSGHGRGSDRGDHHAALSRIELKNDRVRDETTILTFQDLL